MRVVNCSSPQAFHLRAGCLRLRAGIIEDNSSHEFADLDIWRLPGNSLPMESNVRQFDVLDAVIGVEAVPAKRMRQAPDLSEPDAFRKVVALRLTYQVSWPEIWSVRLVWFPALFEPKRTMPNVPSEVEVS